MNTKAFFKLSYGVYIVSANFEDKDGGCVINTLAQVTSSPARLSIALNKDNETLRLIEGAGSFSAVVLAEEADMKLIKTFGFQSSRDSEKFQQTSYERDLNGNPYPTEGIAARFSCKVTDRLDVNTHVILIGEVTEAEIPSDSQVLTYADYHSKKEGTTPKNAPSYQESQTKGFRCSVCGYILEADELPADFICPVCGKDASYFEKID